MIEQIQKQGHHVKLFSKHRYYYQHGNWVRYVEKLVNGQLRKTNQIMCQKKLEDIYPEIQKVYDGAGNLLLSRKKKVDQLKAVNKSSEETSISEKTQFMRPLNLTVSLLSETDKVALKSMLERDGVNYCEFKDSKSVTRIKTSPRGYRLISLIV